MAGSDSERQQPAPAWRKLSVWNLTCGEGGTLARLAGARRLDVNAGTEMAYVDYDPGVASVAGLIAPFERCGHRAVQAGGQRTSCLRRRRA